MKTGIGLRSAHHSAIAQDKPDVGFLEAHSENYFGRTPARHDLFKFREDYPISLHGVGLSLGRADNLDQNHLMQLKRLSDEVEPIFVSEHMSWSAYSHRHLPDLLPLPLIEESLSVMIDHVQQMQDALQRQILVENPSNYLAFDQVDMTEPDFLNQLAEVTGCGLLLDVNNIYVSSRNLNRDANIYIDSLDSQYIKQYHLAGYLEQERDGEVVLIDTHDHPVYSEVWGLFEKVLSRHGNQPTLVEWDSQLPELNILVGEANKADAIKNKFTLQDNLQNSESEHVSGSISKSALSEVSVELLEHIQSTILDTILARSRKSSFVKKSYIHRLGIYNQNVYGGIHDYLKSVFPATNGVVGDDFFKQLIHEFIQTNPPEKGNMHDYGEQLISFIEKHDALKELPYLTDLVRYEWAQHKAFYADITIDLCVSFAHMEQERILTTDFFLNSSVTILRTGFPVSEIYKQSHPDYTGEVNVSLDMGGEYLLIAQKVEKNRGFVEVEQVSEVLFELLEKMSTPITISHVIDKLSEHYEHSDISQALAYVLSSNLLITKRSKEVI